MNLFTSFMLISLVMWILPIIHENSLYPSYVKATISCTFITSLIPTTMFTYSGQEMIISNWHWVTIQTLKLSLSFKLDYFSMMFMPVALFITWPIMEFSK